MYRRLVIVAVAVALVVAAGAPASAATYFQLRYWSTNQLWNAPGAGPDTWSSPMFGFSIRRDIIGGAWALSFNYDNGPLNNAAGLAASPGDYNRFWNLNLHRNFSLTNGMASVYAGYGSLAIEGPTFPYHVRQRGPRVGIDAKVNFRENWYVVGDVAYTFGGTAEQLNYSIGGLVNLNASAVEYRAGLGYMRGRWGIEGGYRVIDWRHNTAAFCGGPSCSFNWSGWYAAVNLTTP
jgi:hypothetical protein